MVRLQRDSTLQSRLVCIAAFKLINLKNFPSSTEVVSRSNPSSASTGSSTFFFFFSSSSSRPIINGYILSGIHLY